VALATMVLNGLQIDRRIHCLADLAECAQLAHRLTELARARLHLVEQTRVLDRDHGLVGEGGEQLDLFFGERAHGKARQAEDADRGSFSQKGRADHGVEATDLLNSRQLVFRIGLRIDDMHGRAFKQRPAGHALTPGLELQARKLGFELRRKTEVCPRAKQAAFRRQRDVTDVRLANSRGRLDERIEHGLQVKGRAADHLEHIGGRGLLFQRLAQLACARLHLFKQTHVLNCDHRLIGERLHQLNLLSGKWPYLSATDRKRADCGVSSQQRNRENCPVAQAPRERVAFREFIASGHEVGHVDRRTIDNGAPSSPGPGEGQFFEIDGDWAVMCSEHEGVSLSQKNNRIICLAKTRR
jgi:hypothetical protein